MAFPIVGFAVVTILLAVYYIRFRSSSRRPKYLKEIPGPRGLPIIGNIHQMGTFQHRQYTQWSKQYGDIYKLKMGPYNMVVVSDPKLAKEIFSDPNFSGKPTFEVFDIYEDHAKLGIFGSEGEPWEAHRRFLLRQLRDLGFGKSAMEPLIMEEVNEVIDRFKREQGKPIESLRGTIRLAVVNSLWTIVTSKRFDHDDPNPKLLELALNTSEVFNDVASIGALRIFIPYFKRLFPEISGYKALRKVNEDNKALFEETVREHKANLQSENLRNFIDVYLAEMNKTTDPESPFYGERAERFLVATLFDLFFAGSDTTATTLAWTILFLCKHPETQRKLQQEIDEITGNTRNVSVSDRSNMPFTLAVIDEVLRHSSLVPDGVQHRAMADKEFHGYFIPKDTWVQPNLYYIHHNPNIWGDPENFRPERFLSSDGKKYVKSENLQAFQVGRRQCVGETLARDTLFLYVTNIFQQFSIKFDPNSPEPTLDLATGFFRIPLPYSVVMTDRLQN